MNEYNQKGSLLYGTYSAAVVMVNDNIDAKDVKTKLVDLGYDAQTAQDLMSFIFSFINVLQGILLGLVR